MSQEMIAFVWYWFCLCYTFVPEQLTDTRQAIMDKQSQVDEMEMQLMSSAPDSVQYVIDLRTQLSHLYDQVTFSIIFASFYCYLIIYLFFFV